MNMEPLFVLQYALLVQGCLCLVKPTATPQSDVRTKLRVSTIVEPPFLLMRDISVDGNDRFSGFMKDLLDEMTSDPEIDADYDLLTVADGQYGRKILRGKWNGMIGEVYRKEVDLAAAPLVPSEERGKIVDFSRPYMQGGITMLTYRDPDSKTANKAPTITAPRDLLNRTDVVPGFVQHSSVQNFFENTENPVYRDIYQRMYETKLKPNPFAITVEDGINNIREFKDKYVLFVDSNVAEYYAAKWPCDLVLVGDLNRQSFVLTFPKNSPLKPKFNRVLEKLNDNGRLKKLVDKWWTGDCASKVGVYKHRSPPQTIGVEIEPFAGQTKAGAARLGNAGLLIVVSILVVTTWMY